jgi:hypothetical protein
MSFYNFLMGSLVVQPTEWMYKKFLFYLNIVEWTVKILVRTWENYEYLISDMMIFDWNCFPPFTFLLCPIFQSFLNFQLFY